MIRIAICDDEEVYIRMIEAVITEELQKEKQEYHIDTYIDGEHLLAHIDQYSYDMIFLDIVMKYKSGFEVAERIYEYTRGDNLIFVSHEESMVYQAFQFRPFRFVNKANINMGLSAAVYDWLNEREREYYIEIKGECGKKLLGLHSVEYMEVKAHYVYIHTIEEVYRVRGTISDYLYLTLEHGFIRPHVSYLCNLSYIYAVDPKNIIMKSRDIIPISRGKYEECNNQYMKYVRNR